MPYDGDDYDEGYYDYGGYNEGYGGYNDKGDYYYDYPEDYQDNEEYYESYDYPDEYAGYGGDEGYEYSDNDIDREYTDYTEQGLSPSFHNDDEDSLDAEDNYSRTIWSDIFQGGMVLLIFILALLPPLVYFLAIIKIKEGHISWLYQTTLTLIVVRLLFFATLGPDGPQIMLGLSMMCLLFAAASAIVFLNKGTPHIDDYIISAFTSTGESTWQRWLKFYSVIAVYIGFCPLLWYVLVLDMATECCYGHEANIGAIFLIIYALIGAVCNALEALRKNANAGAEAGHEGRRDLEMDGNTKEDVQDDELERLSLI